jgi:methanogenic corrinoid protein MtbC1
VGERRDLGLIAFGLALRERGWRIDYLGPDTPAQSLAEAARHTDPSVIVLAPCDPSR